MLTSYTWGKFRVNVANLSLEGKAHPGFDMKVKFREHLEFSCNSCIRYWPVKTSSPSIFIHPRYVKTWDFNKIHALITTEIVKYIDCEYDVDSSETQHLWMLPHQHNSVTPSCFKTFVRNNSTIQDDQICLRLLCEPITSSTNHKAHKKTVFIWRNWTVPLSSDSLRHLEGWGNMMLPHQVPYHA